MLFSPFLLSFVVSAVLVVVVSVVPVTDVNPRPFGILGFLVLLPFLPFPSSSLGLNLGFEFSISSASCVYGDSCVPGFS